MDHTRKSTCDRHLGIDQRQRGNTNNGAIHRRNLRIWTANQNGNPVANGDGDNGQPDYDNLRSGFILICMKAGCNAAQTAFIAKELFGSYPMQNSGTVPQTKSGMYLH